MMIRIAAVAFALCACSSSSSGRTPPASCDPAQVAGTYLLHYDAVSGNCGALPDSLIIVGGAPGTASNCAVASVTRSRGNCRADVSERCPSSAGPLQITGYVVQESADGSFLDGELTVSLTACVETYRVSYTRQ